MLAAMADEKPRNGRQLMILFLRTICAIQQFDDLRVLNLACFENKVA